MRGTDLGITELLRRGIGQVDDAVRIERPTVVHPQDHAAAVGQVGHPHVGRQRQGLVRRAHAVQVVQLAVGGVLAMELGAVPRRGTLRAIVARVLHRVVGLAQHRVRVGLVVAGVHGWRGVGDLVHIHIPPRRAVLVRPVDVQARLGAYHVATALLGRAVGRTAGQHHADGEAGEQLERVAREDCAHYLTPRA
ncbi:hypothetical protein D3C72_1494940 [compost metagenome]